MLCFLYVIGLGACLALAGLLVERALPPGVPRRWLWLAVIALNVAVPALYQAQHRVLVGATGGAPDPSWWARISMYDAVLIRLWVIASAALLVWGVAHALWVSQLVRRSRKAAGDSGAALVDGIPVVLTESLGPATVGVVRARVLVPRWVLAMPALQQQYVLRHEHEHRRAHDARLLFAASLLLIVTPWNLALWWQLRRLSLAIELDCDDRVIGALGDANTYGELLLRVAEATSRGPRLQPGLLGGAGMLERRLASLVAPAQLPRAMRYLVPALAVGFLLMILSIPHPVLAPPATAHAAGASGAAVVHHTAQ